MSLSRSSEDFNSLGSASVRRSLAICALALIVGAPALATTGVQVNISRPLTLFPIGTSDLSLRSANSPVSLTSETAFGEASAYADFGVIKTRTTMTGNVRVPDSHVQVPSYPYPLDRTSAGAFWQDDLVISGQSGNGFLDVSLYIDAAISTLFPTAEGRSSANLSVYLNKTDSGGCTLCGPTWSFGVNQNRYRDGNGVTSQIGGTEIYTPGPDFIDRSFPSSISWSGWQNFSIPITFGTTFELRVGAQCFTAGDTGVFAGGNRPITRLSGAAVGATCDLGNSVYWGGISGVRLANGDVVRSFGLTSVSGFDYRNASPALPAIPEPATWALMIVGFGIVGGMARKGRRSATAVNFSGMSG